MRNVIRLDETMYLVKHYIKLRETYTSWYFKTFKDTGLSYISSSNLGKISNTFFYIFLVDLLEY